MSATRGSTGHVRLTTRAHQVIASILRQGDLAIDATVGNGVDTEFLARQVGPQGQVLGLDIQGEAIERTRRRLSVGRIENVILRQADHAVLAEVFPNWIGNVAAVMFNLGYLPHGDQAITTTAESTVTALNAALAMLHVGGVITILAYRAHPGGRPEFDAVANWRQRLPVHFTTKEFASLPGKCDGPHLYVVRSVGEPSNGNLTRKNTLSGRS